MLPRPAAIPLRKIEPFLASPALVDLVVAVATAMSNALAPITFAAAARELIARGSDVLEASLAQDHPVSWRALHPPRGRRRADAPPPAGDAKTFVLVSPLSLPESLIQRLKALCGRLESTTKSPVSLAMVVRETIVVGHEARERGRRQAQELLAQQTAALHAVGLPGPLEFIAVSSVLRTPYTPRGPTDPWASPPRSRAPRTPSPPKAAATAPRTAQRARARAPRKKTAARRADRTEGSDDDGADPPQRSDALEPPAHATAAPPQPLTDTDRRLLDYFIEMALRA